ncbi:MAG: hypothetical protein WDW38_007621 [Sanguina aurantia]
MRLEGVLAPNVFLQRHSVRLFDGIVDGAESVVVDKDQAVMWMLDRFGNVWRAERVPTPPHPEEPAAGSQYALEQAPFTHLGPGRPLGAALDANGDLLVCDSLKGLLKVETGTAPGSQARRITILTSRVSGASRLDPGSPITYANDLDVHPDGTVYFTASQDISVGVSADGSFWDTLASYMTGLYAGAFTGRLLSYTPSTGVTQVLATGFWFSNGVALAADASYVAFVETNRMRVMRYWLKGDKTGSVDVLIDRLPGFPDGISRAPDGSFWVALVSRPSPVLKYLRYRLVRTILSQLPPQLNIRPPAWGAVIKRVPIPRRVIPFPGWGTMHPSCPPVGPAPACLSPATLM